MRSFVAASCCLIVGLEILIGVPVAVCVGMLSFGSAAGPGVYVSEAQFTAPTCPPPIYSAPTYYPAPASIGPYDPSFPPPLKPSAMDAAPNAPPIVASLPASDPAANPLPPLATAWNAAPPNEAPQYLARVCADESCPPAGTDASDSAKESPPEKALAASLHASAELLYQQADRHESDQEYDLADRLRSLARDLRDEAGSISRRSPTYDPGPVGLPSAAEPAEPRTVTVGPPPLG